MKKSSASTVTVDLYIRIALIVTLYSPQIHSKLFGLIGVTIGVAHLYESTFVKYLYLQYKMSNNRSPGSTHTSPTYSTLL